MRINPLDTSNYFRGLLVLVSREKQINQKERTLLKKIGRILGFNQNFIDSAIDDLSNNKYVKTEVPLFSNCEVVELFLKDGIKLAFANDTLTIKQIEWLMAIAIRNRISKQWFFIELENYIENCSTEYNEEFELPKYFVPSYAEAVYVYQS
jgi:hypothetical protein